MTKMLPAKQTTKLTKKVYFCASKREDMLNVNEIFYSIQGEGANTGTAATFVRLSGCNLRCPFCDTEYQSGAAMDEKSILEQIEKHPGPWVVITGGEPTLQNLDNLIEEIHKTGKKVAIETNGTHPVPAGADWVTVSPKTAFVSGADVVVSKADEVKVVFDGEHDVYDHGIEAKHYFVQPCDIGNPDENRRIVEQCVAFILQNPKWKLSMQVHKVIHVK